MVKIEREISKKIEKKSLNPQGNGVLRFLVLNVLDESQLPLAASEVRKKLSPEYHGVSLRLIGKILSEIAIATPGARQIVVSQKRIVKTKCIAYHIIKPR